MPTHICNLETYFPELTRKDTPKQKAATPENTSKPLSTGFTPKVPSTSVIPSDTDGSDVGTPLGSTISKTGSFLHSRTVSTESPRPVEVSKRRGSPKASDSLFSSTEEKGDNQEPVQTRRRSSGNYPNIFMKSVWRSCHTVHVSVC